MSAKFVFLGQFYTNFRKVTTTRYSLFARPHAQAEFGAWVFFKMAVAQLCGGLGQSMFGHGPEPRNNRTSSVKTFWQLVQVRVGVVCVDS